VAESLEREFPNFVVSRMQKNLRAGKILVDWSQNDDHKTTVCVYSLRAKDHPTVSTPVTWEEVARALKQKSAQLLTFEAADVLKRVKSHGDLFAPVLTLKQQLPRLHSGLIPNQTSNERLLMNPESLGTYENLFSGARRMPGAEQRRILVLVTFACSGRNIELIGRT